MMGRSEPKLVDRVSSSSDEEIDEDEAFNSDDERLYGALFEPSKKKTGNSRAFMGDDDSHESVEDLGSDFDLSDDGIASADDEDEDGDGGQYMLNLLDNLDKKPGDELNRNKNEPNPTSLLPESEFSSVAMPNSNLTLDQLMNGISDTSKFSSVKKTMKGMVRDESSLLDDNDPSKLRTPSAPVAKIVSERAQRKVAYQDQIQNVSEWTTAVKQNREAETLDFRPRTQIGKATKDTMVGKFQATTDFEKEIEQALQDANAVNEKELIAQQGDKDIFGWKDEMDAFDDDLGTNRMTPEEYKKQQGRVAKMKALMFYDEQKRHHMHKIKSKKYHKIRKKQRMKAQKAEDEQAAQEDEQYAKELEEKQEMERMKERMSLKHKNTSKWAKRMLRRGKNVDIDTRRALSEQIRVGDDLKKKMLWNNSDDEGDGDEDLLNQAKRILTETEKDTSLDKEPEKGLFSLSFMKKGLEKQRERAKEEARELLRELRSAEDFGNSDGIDENSDGEVSSEEREKGMTKAASAKAMAKILLDGKLQSSMLDFGNSTSVAVSGEITVYDNKCEDDANLTTLAEVKQKSLESMKTKHNGSETILRPSQPSSKVKSQTNTVTNGSNEIVPKDLNEKEQLNPWLQTSTEHSNADKLSTITDGLKHNPKYVVKSVEATVTHAPGRGNIILSDNEISSEKSNRSEVNSCSNDKIVSLSQEELARRAFVSPADAEVDAEFEKEKNKMQERDENPKKSKLESKAMSGWGSWAGQGSLPPKPKKKLGPPSKSKKASKRQRADDGLKDIIINAKRIKKNANFQLNGVPHPYSSREEYERAMSGAIGAEWNVSSAVKDLTRPEVIIRRGVMIQPLSQKAKTKKTSKL